MNKESLSEKLTSFTSFTKRCFSDGLITTFKSDVPNAIALVFVSVLGLALFTSVIGGGSPSSINPNFPYGKMIFENNVGGTNLIILDKDNYQQLIYTVDRNGKESKKMRLVNEKVIAIKTTKKEADKAGMINAIGYKVSFKHSFSGARTDVYIFEGETVENPDERKTYLIETSPELGPGRGVLIEVEYK